jgi:hypothetical protein
MAGTNAAEHNPRLLRAMLRRGLNDPGAMAVTYMKDGSISVRDANRADVQKGTRLRLDVPKAVVDGIDPEFEHAVAIQAMFAAIAAEERPSQPATIIAPLVRACTQLAGDLSLLAHQEEATPDTRPKRLRIHCPSPFGPARAFFAMGHVGIELPRRVIDHYGIGGGWMIHHSEAGSPMTIVSALSAVSPIAPTLDVADLLRNPVLHDMRHLAETLAGSPS